MLTSILDPKIAFPTTFVMNGFHNSYSLKLVRMPQILSGLESTMMSVSIVFNYSNE